MAKAKTTPVGSDADTLSGQAGGQLKAFVARIERLNGEKDDLTADIKEIYLEAKGSGFDTKILRKVIRIAAQDKAKRQEEEALIELYLSAIGLL